MGIELAGKSKETRKHAEITIWTQINIYTETFSVLTDYFQYFSAPIYIKPLIFLSL